MKIGYLRKKIVCKILHLSGEKSCEYINSYFRKCGAIVGKNCRIYSDITTSESYLIYIGNNVTISNDVQILTHDNSVIKVIPDCTDIFGMVRIGNNTFVGARALILPGVNIGDNCIVGAGSVVTKSVPNGSIIAGNPARVVKKIEEYKSNIRDNVFDITGLSQVEKKKMLIKQKSKWINK